MKFIAKVKTVKADITRKEITISFVLPMYKDNFEEANKLSEYANEDAGDMEIVVTPRQMMLT